MKYKLVILILLFAIFGCKVKKEAPEEPEEPPKIDAFTFYENLFSVPEALVPLETLSDWLQKEIKEASSLKVNYYLWEGEWDKKTVYWIRNNFQATRCGEPRPENGGWFDMSQLDHLLSTSTNWQLIYKIGEFHPSRTKGFNVSERRAKNACGWGTYLASI